MEAIKQYDIIQVVKGAEDMALMGLVIHVGRQHVKCWCRTPYDAGSQGYVFTALKASVARIGKGKMRPRQVAETPKETAPNPSVKHDPPPAPAPPPPQLPSDIIAKAKVIADRIVPDELSAPAVHEIPKPLASHANRNQGPKEKAPETTERETQGETIRPEGKIQGSRRRKVSIPMESKGRQKNLPAPEHSRPGV